MAPPSSALGMAGWVLCSVVMVPPAQRVRSDIPHCPAFPRLLPSLSANFVGPVGHDRGMTSWGDFAAAQPELARRVRQCFAIRKHATLATLRRDGSPRISGTEDDPGSWLGDAKIAGRATEVSDPTDEAHRFAVDVLEVVHTSVGTPADHLVIESWHPDRPLQRRCRCRRRAGLRARRAAPRRHRSARRVPGRRQWWAPRHADRGGLDPPVDSEALTVGEVRSPGRHPGSPGRVVL